eukprot:gene6664-biopygen1858
MDSDTVMGGTAAVSTTAADTSEAAKAAAGKAEADRLAAIANIIATAQAAASKVMTDQQAADLNEADPFACLWATHMELALVQPKAQLDADKAAGRVPVTAPGAGPSSRAGPSTRTIASQVSRKLPMPAQWTGSNGDNKLPRGRILLDLVVSYCALIGWLFTNGFSFFLAGTAAEWFVNFKQSLAHSRRVLTQAVISQVLLDFYDPSHRDEAKEARKKLLRKECTMIQHRDDIKVNPRKIATVADWPEPSLS